MASLCPLVLGTVELDLRNLVSPAKTPEKCSLDMMDVLDMIVPHKKEKAKSLFAQQSVRGWWPCSIEQDGKKVLGVSMNCLLHLGGIGTVSVQMHQNHYQLDLVLRD